MLSTTACRRFFAHAAAFRDMMTKGTTKEKQTTQMMMKTAHTGTLRVLQEENQPRRKSSRRCLRRRGLEVR